MALRLRVSIVAWAVAGCLACSATPEQVPRSKAYEHTFEVVVVTSGVELDGSSVEILRLRQAEDRISAEPTLHFLPPERGIDFLIRVIEEGSDGDYTQSLRATKHDDTTWELTLSTGGNTRRDVSTYRIDGRSITPVRYERRAAMSRTRRYVYTEP